MRMWSLMPSGTCGRRFAVAIRPGVVAELRAVQVDSHALVHGFGLALAHDGVNGIAVFEQHRGHTNSLDARCARMSR